MTQIRQIAMIAFVLVASANADTLYLKDGTTLDGSVHKPNDNSYVLTVGKSSVTFPSEEVVKFEKNDKVGDYDYNRINPLAVKHAEDMKELTGLTEEQKEEVQNMLTPLGSDDPVVRAEAMQALIEKNKQFSIGKFLSSAASSSTAQIAANVLEVLVKIDPAIAKETLRDRAYDMEPEVRGRALQLMGKSGDTESLTTIAAGLRDHAGEVRIAAAEALGFAGDKRATPALLEQLSNPDKQLQNASMNALKAIWKDDPAAAKAESSDDWTRLWSNQAKQVAEPVALDELTPLVEEPEGGQIIRG